MTQINAEAGTLICVNLRNLRDKKKRSKKKRSKKKRSKKKRDKNPRGIKMN